MKLVAVSLKQHATFVVFRQDLVHFGYIIRYINRLHSILYEMTLEIWTDDRDRPIETINI